MTILTVCTKNLLRWSDCTLAITKFSSFVLFFASTIYALYVLNQSFLFCYLVARCLRESTVTRTVHCIVLVRMQRTKFSMCHDQNISPQSHFCTSQSHFCGTSTKCLSSLWLHTCNAIYYMFYILVCTYVYGELNVYIHRKLRIGRRVHHILLYNGHEWRMVLLNVIYWSRGCPLCARHI